MSKGSVKIQVREAKRRSLLLWMNFETELHPILFLDYILKMVHDFFES